MHILTTILMEQLHFSPATLFSILPPDNATGNFKNSSTFTRKITIDANNDIEK
jgi:hypothetical protein